jgi:hypothetical protein
MLTGNEPLTKADLSIGHILKNVVNIIINIIFMLLTTGHAVT